jgi:hypothetical protein
MLDLSYFQNNYSNTQMFTSAGAWQTWVKPRAAKFVNILCLGSGGGGGGGFTAASGNRGGAAGGGSTTFTKANYQASILPDILYVYTGIGGVRGTGGGVGVVTSGGAGQLSYVAISPNTSSIANIVVVSGTAAAGGGVSGSAANTGTPVNGGTSVLTLNTSAIFLNLGTFIISATTAQVGGAGLAGNANGGGVTVASIITGGGGGAGTTGTAGPFTGGAITATGAWTAVPNATGFGSNGNHGVIMYNPILTFTGGTGGNSHASGVGGNGGNGAYGSGGGGGGGGTTGGGNGGRGGDGLVIITTSF